MCVRDVVQKTVKFSDTNWFEGLSMNCITKLTIVDVPIMSAIDVPMMSVRGAPDDPSALGVPTLPVLDVPTVSAITSPASCSVTALVLPESHSWPTFQDRKQRIAEGKNVVLVKKAPLVVEFDTGTESKLVDFLLIQRHVVLVGHPGVGKSTELNIILVDLFHALAERKIPYLFHRVHPFLYRYRCSERDGVTTILCEKAHDFDASLSGVTGYFDHMYLRDDEPQPVLVLEMDDDERHPKCWRTSKHGRRRVM